VKRGAAADPWHHLRTLTAARIGLGRAGGSLPTRELLAFGLAHAQARDAVRQPLDDEALGQALDERGFAHLSIHSAAADRTEYLRRPDLGRRLVEADRNRLAAAAPEPSPDLVLVLADGLSATAVQRHALPMLDALQPRLADWTLAPIVIALQARVALGDEIGALLRARQLVMLIGERPGLSSPDSLGIYLTHAPRPGRVDAERNCISNVRPDGLSFEQAAARLSFLMRGAHALGRSGVALKDDSRPSLPDEGRRP